MKRPLTVLLLMGLLVSRPAYADSAADSRFEALAQRYIEALLVEDPEGATDLGDHRYDDRLTDRSAATEAKDRRFNQTWLKELGHIHAAQLSEVNRIDYAIWKNHLEAALFEIDSVRESHWNPLYYNCGDAFYTLLTRDFAPLPDRLRLFKKRLEALPAILDEARANLQNPPQIHTETAILQNDGVVSLLQDDLKPFLDQAPGLAEELAPARQRAIDALKAYGAWLKTDLLPRSHGDFRLGDERFRKKLRYVLESDMSKEELLSRAQTEVRAIQDQMYATALPLYRQFFPEDQSESPDKKTVIRKVLSRLADEHPTQDTILASAKQVLQDATDFVRTHNLVGLPSDPVRVVLMPEFERGVSVASCEAPGPLEKHGDTMYNIAPPPSDWTPQRAASFFRENNNYMLQDLTVHEAMPGHYVQLWHARSFSAPTRLRAIFESGVFVEGWAVYTEQVMAEAGFGGPREHLEQLKMRLRATINSILDQQIHTAGMTEKDAMSLMMDEGFQEEGEAAGKWRRACLTSTQLSTYFVGVTEMNGIRQAWQAQHGSDDVRGMHDLMLSFGSCAPRYVRMLMHLPPTGSSTN